MSFCHPPSGNLSDLLDELHDVFSSLHGANLNVIVASDFNIIFFSCCDDTLQLRTLFDSFCMLPSVLEVNLGLDYILEGLGLVYTMLLPLFTIATNGIVMWSTPAVRITMQSSSKQHSWSRYATSVVVSSWVHALTQNCKLANCRHVTVFLKGLLQQPCLFCMGCFRVNVVPNPFNIVHQWLAI